MLPRTTILLLLFLTAFIWIAVILMLLLAVRLRCIIWDLSRSFLLRLAITIFSIILIYTMAQVNVVGTQCVHWTLDSQHSPTFCAVHVSARGPGELRGQAECQDPEPPRAQMVPAPPLHPDILHAEVITNQYPHTPADNQNSIPQDIYIFIPYCGPNENNIV